MTKGEIEFEGMIAEKANAVYQPGKNAEMDAWFNAFFIENHIDHFTYPTQAAPPEQIRFMVYFEGNDRYYPCSDRMFEAIMTRKQSAFLQKKYAEVFQKILKLIDEQIEDQFEKDFLESLIIIKFKHETRDEIMIPSRIEKRLLGLFLLRTQIEDPYLYEKNNRNVRMKNALSSQVFLEAINAAKATDFENLPATLSDIKNLVDYIELKRLVSLSVVCKLWETDEAKYFKAEDYNKIFEQPILGEGVGRLFDFLGIAKN